MTISQGPPILVVEDSDEDFETVLDAARKAGFRNELRRAVTGEECLALLRGDGGDAVRPAFVLMDLNTPGLDGRQALAVIKADTALKELPVVVLTTSANPKDLAFCYRAGAGAYHVKPIRYPDHLRVLDDIFGYWLGSVLLPEPGGYRS